MRKITAEEYEKYQKFISSAKEDVIKIPNNATNGDVIKTLFPNAIYECVKTLSGVNFTRVKGLDAWGLEQHFHDEWWNAPYKREAYDMAIEALQESVLDKIRAEIKQTADEEQKHDEKWAIGLRYAIQKVR